MSPTRSAGLAIALALAACEAQPVTVAVELRTNLVPEVEIDRARADLIDSSGAIAAEGGTELRFGDDVTRGVRVAELVGPSAGDYRVRVRVERDGAVVTERVILASVRASRVVTVLITRDCRARACGDGESCVAGRCQPEACSEDTPETCAPAACLTDADCASVTTVACAEALCAAGVCAPFPVHDRCTTGEYCEPERGCAALPWAPLDAGAPDAGAADAGVELGTWETGSFGGCDRGTQRRSVTCIGADGAPLPDAQCPDPRPSPSRSCSTSTDDGLGQPTGTVDDSLELDVDDCDIAFCSTCTRRVSPAECESHCLAQARARGRSATCAIEHCDTECRVYFPEGVGAGGLRVFSAWP